MEAYPLSWPVGWPREKDPTRSRFGTWADKPSVYNATNYIFGELKRMKINSWDVIISTNLTLRNDGLPRSSQKAPEDTGVAVYFKRKEEMMVIACDTFDTVGCNLWSVAKTVEAMRGIERWGCSELLNRAFTGFKALPENASESVSSYIPWWDILQVSKSADKSLLTSAYKNLALRYHPDNPKTGDQEKFMLVQEAFKQGVMVVPE